MVKPKEYEDLLQILENDIPIDDLFDDRPEERVEQVEEEEDDSVPAEEEKEDAVEGPQPLEEAVEELKQPVEMATLYPSRP